MKVYAAAVMLLMIAISISSCKTKKTKSETATYIIYQSKNSDSFNLAFDSVLSEYKLLKTAFINWDTTAANKIATSLQHLLIYVPYEQLKDEAAATKATSIAQNASDELQVLLSQDSINNKRRIFYTVSESIYSLAKKLYYDKAVKYHKKCPMDFIGDEEAWWFYK